MSRQTPYLIILSLLLVVLGFLLGQYFSLSGAKLWSGIREKGFFTEDTSAGALEIEKAGPVMELGVEEHFSQEYAEGTVESEKILFPRSVGELLKDRLISGEEAMELSEKIHGCDVPIERVFISYYSGGDSQAILWVFEMSTVSEASRHLEKINRRIEESESFTRCDSFLLEKEEIFHVDGLNMNNYYYRKGNTIYWISLVTDNPLPLFLEFYDQF